MKKITIVFVVAGLLTIGAYIFTRFALKTPGVKPAQAADTSYRTKPQETFLDLRPKLVQRLQELVSKGSNRLYQLHIAEVDPDVLASTVTLKNISLEPDMAVISRMSRAEKEGCDIFKFRSDSIHISGIGVKDILTKDIIDLKKVFINSPVIDIIQRSSAQTKNKPTLYECLFGQLKRLSADEIIINNGTLVNHATRTDKPVSFKNLYVRLSDLRVDSSTQNDRSRFLFSKEARLSLKNYSASSKDGFYDYAIDEISITTNNHLLTARNVKLQPRFNKSSFASRAGMAKERYDLAISTVKLKNIDWWGLASNKTLVADEAILDGGDLDVYLNRSLPQKISRVGNYPHQLLMKLPMKVNVRKVTVNGIRFKYAEFNPQSGKQGGFSIKNMNGTITNLTNMPSAIRSNPLTNVNASGIFMGLSQADLSLQLNLDDVKNGSFKAGLKVKGFDGKLINPIAEPIGMFSIKKGNLKELRSTVQGNNNSASGKVVFLYDDLHIAALEKDAGKKGGLDKKDVTSFFANAVLVKNQNPSGSKEARTPDCSFMRDPYSSFFNLIWKTTFVGILKTTGLPEKLAYKK